MPSTVHSVTNAMLREPLSFDAIVIGAGAAGLTAARGFARAGRSVLVLDAGDHAGFFSRPYANTVATGVRLVARPEIERLLHPKLVSLGRKGLKLFGSVRQPRQCRFFAWELDPNALIDDRDHPYTTSKGTDFAWYRRHGVNGKMTVPGHGQQYSRLPDACFEKRNGPAPAWPISGRDLTPWYDDVSKLLGLASGESGAQSVALTAAETALSAALQERWPGLDIGLGVAAPWPEVLDHVGQAGRVSFRAGACVRQVNLGRGGALKGVTWADGRAGGDHSAEAPIVFVCASTIETTRILLNSRSSEFPKGIGADGGALGKYLMDHVSVSAQGIGPAVPDGSRGRVPGRCLYASRLDQHVSHDGAAPFGAQIYQSALSEKRSRYVGVSFAEMEPNEANQVTLHPKLRDKNGIPIVNIAFEHSERDFESARAQAAALREIAAITGSTLYQIS